MVVVPVAITVKRWLGNLFVAMTTIHSLTTFTFSSVVAFFYNDQTVSSLLNVFFYCVHLSRCGNYGTIRSLIFTPRVSTQNILHSISFLEVASPEHRCNVIHRTTSSSHQSMKSVITKGTVVTWL